MAKPSSRSTSRTKTPAKKPLPSKRKAAPAAKAIAKPKSKAGAEKPKAKAAGAKPKGARAKPSRTHVDATFGTLAWDDTLEWWVGRMELAGANVEIDVSTEELPIEDAMAIARTAWGRIVANEKELRSRCATELLPVHQESWSDGRKISLEDFVAWMTPQSVCLYADGSADLFYDDGDLFDGHTIAIAVDKSGRFADADLAG